MNGLYILSGAILLGIGAALGYYVGRSYGHIAGWNDAYTKAEREMAPISNPSGMGRR